MVTSNIVELDSISIKVVQNGHTEFVTHTVIRLRTTISESRILKLGSFRKEITQPYPPVLDQSGVDEAPLGQLTVLEEWLTCPPVQKYFKGLTML